MLPVGSPAVGKDFVDRENEIKLIIDSLKKDNILLIAPRKYGKTSIMRKVERVLDEKSPVVFLDVYYIDAPEDFLIEVAAATYDGVRDKKRFIEKLKSSFTKLKELEEAEVSLVELKFRFKKSLKEDIKKKDWKDEGRTIFTEIKNSFEDSVYFIIDEFSECVHNMSEKNKKEAEIFLKWFKSLRMKKSSLRFIIGGSVSIDRVVRNVTTLSTITDFKRVIVDGFSRETALNVVKKVFEEEGWTYNGRIAKKIVECIGVPSVPYFLSVFLSIIQEESAGKNLDEKTIEEIYNSKLMGTQGKHYFDYYVQRLKIYYSEKEEKAAKAILKELCQIGEISIGIAFDIFKNVMDKDDYERFIDLISDLENDFYLKQTEDKIIFYSKTLVDWWRLYHV